MNLLVIEDDRKLNRMLCEILEKEGYTVKACTDGEEGAYYLQQNAYDLALVDWMLPGESGPDILRESRRKGIMTPVVMLTALTAVENKVTCLDAGADDYLGKPFDSRELLARVRANLRRQAPIEELVVLRYGDLVYDTKALLLACGREEIAVSKKLGLMIELFMKSKGQALARATLFARVWGADADVEEHRLFPPAAGPDPLQDEPADRSRCWVCPCGRKRRPLNRPRRWTFCGGRS